MPADAPSNDLFAQIIDAPDRDGQPGCPRLLSYRDDDEPDFLSAVDARARTRVELTRRGQWHGSWAEIPARAATERGGPPLAAVLAQRWHTARPILLPGAIEASEYADELAGRARLFDELKEPGGLRAYLKSLKADLAPHFSVHPHEGALSDPERDIERVRITWTLAPEGPGPRMRDLWMKSAWLSSYDDEDSLRLRLSFGREVDDDASRDVARHQRVRDLAELVLPECGLIHDHPRIPDLLAELCGGPVFFTQHIAYWNSPGGGALFHHDGFHEPGRGGQRGVCFAQLEGRSAWLALSIEDLARRVIEFGEYLEEGELSWVRAQVFAARGSFERFRKKSRRFMSIMRELAKPGCGFLGPLVNRGPEFTSFLADCGHAWLLHPGDVLLLANHELVRTAAHSVFCPDESTSYGLSMAIRDVYPPEPLAVDELVEELQQSDGPAPPERSARPDERGPRRGTKRRPRL